MGESLDKLKESKKQEREASDYSNLQDLSPEERQDLSDFMRYVNDSRDYEEAQEDLSKYTENKAWSGAGGKRKKFAKKALALYNKMKNNPKYKGILPKYHGHDTRAQEDYEINVGKDANGKDIILNAESNISHEKLRHNVAKTKEEVRVDEFIRYENIRKAKREEREGKLARHEAFSKLGTQPGLLKARHDLGRRAKRGISPERRALEKATVGAAIQGKARGVRRRIQSILAGQGMRGVDPSRFIQNIEDKASKQKARFDMSQMARSYADQASAQDSKAKMEMDIAQADIGQDKAALEFMEGRRTFQGQQRANFLNVAQSKGKGSFQETSKGIETLGL